MDAYIENLLQTVRFGEPASHGALTLLPVTASLPPGPRYVTLGEAMAAGAFTVTEVDSGGSVPELVARNDGGTAVLLLDGEELCGAKQNRVLNTTVLIGAGKEYVVPVSCTERGRWSYVSARFGDSGLIASHKLRHRLKEGVAASAREYETHMSCQASVWAEVEDLHARANTESRTRAMADAYAQRATDLEGFTGAFRPAAGQNGIAAVQNGRVVGLEVLSRPEAYARLHDRLVRSYAFDAMVDGGAADAQRDATAAKRFVVSLADTVVSDHASPAMGRTRNYTGEGVVGTALTYRNAIVHAAFFAPAV